MIDHHLTCEVDFSTISLRIIYASVGESIGPEADLYDIGLPGWSGEDDPRRKPIKVFVNAMMNDESGNYRLPKTALDSIGITHEELKAKVLDRHSKIAEKVTDGVGLSTQLLDSQIAERVILSMLANDILVLPIHDSFIVRRGMEQDLKMTMQNIFEQATGSRGKVSTEYLRSSKDFGITKGEIEAEILKVKEDPSLGIISTADVFKAIQSEEPDNNEDYLNSWREWSQVPPKRLWLSNSQHKDVIGYLGSPFAQHPTALTKRP